MKSIMRQAAVSAVQHAAVLSNTSLQLGGSP